MSPIRFEIDSSAPPLQYKMGYCAADRSLMALSRPCGSVGGVSLGDELHIEWEMVTDDLLALLNPEGLFHLEWAKHAKLSPPSAEVGRVIAPMWPQFSTGGNYKIKPRISRWRTMFRLPTSAWRTAFDPDSNWMCIGNRFVPPGARCVATSPSFLVVIHEFELIAAWVHVDAYVSPTGDRYA